MARPKSDDKHNALLLAAEQVFAKRGLAAAPTSAISKQAGVAEGTLFTYFRTKDDLVNAFVDWGVENPQRLNVLDQLSVADVVSEESKAVGYEPFAEIEALAQNSIDTGILHAYPVAFIAASMKSMAETTMAFMTACPAEASQYRTIGFKVFWNGIARNAES